MLGTGKMLLLLRARCDMFVSSQRPVSIGSLSEKPFFLWSMPGRLDGDNKSYRYQSIRSSTHHGFKGMPTLVGEVGRAVGPIRLCEQLADYGSQPLNSFPFDRWPSARREE